MRQAHWSDRWLEQADTAVRTVLAPAVAARAQPVAESAPQERGQAALTEDQRRHAGALMRVNHVGEVCAQALYAAQALFAREAAQAAQLRAAAQEESDHLAWTKARLDALQSRPSLLNPLWYAGSFLMGAAAAKVGDAWSLGFVAETERQVEVHLEGHLAKLPAADTDSAAVLEQMRRDEAEHRLQAEALGAQPLPPPVKLAMRSVAKVMTATAYWI